MLDLTIEANRLKVDFLTLKVAHLEKVKIGSLSNSCNSKNKIIKEIRGRIRPALRINRNLVMTPSLRHSTSFRGLPSSIKPNNLMRRSRPSFNFRNFIKCRSLTKWPKCNSLDSKLSYFSAKIWLSSNSGRCFNSSAITKPRSRCRTSSIKWCLVKVFMETICKFSRHNMPLLRQLHCPINKSPQVMLADLMWAGVG